MHRALRLLFLLMSIWLFHAGLATARAEGREVALITALSGQATLTARGDQDKAVPAQAFMKVESGDVFDLPENASLQLLYFVNGRQETWKGPAAFAAGDMESRVVKSEAPPPQPVVKILPNKASRRIGASFPVSDSHIQTTGAIQTMGPGKAPASAGAPKAVSPRAYSPKDPKDLDKARKTCRDLRKTASDDDVTPELFLLSVLADHQRYREMKEIIDGMLQKYPENSTLRELKAWADSQAGLSK